MKFKKHILENGLRVILAPIKNNPTVTFSVFVEAGSNYEEKNENGLSHFLEHMCFNGTKTRPTPREVVYDLDKIGAVYNAFTSNEYTGYFAKSAKEHIDIVFDVVSDIYLNSVFPEESLKKEKGVVIEEINMYNDLPQQKVWNIFLNLLYGDTPAGRPILGPKENILAFDRSMIEKYRGNLYKASSTLVVVSGDFVEDQILEKIKKTFKDLRADETRQKSLVVENQDKSGFEKEDRKTDQTHFVLGVRTFSLNDPRSAILNVLNGVLSAGMGSRLFEKMRTELGICYYIRSEVDFYTDHGYLAVSSGVNPGRFEEAIGAVSSEFKKLKNELVNEEELLKVKNYLIGNLELSLETSDQVGGFLAVQEILKKEIQTPEEIAEKIKAVTAEDIKKLAGEIFSSNNINLVVIGDGAQEDKIRKLLEI